MPPLGLLPRLAKSDVTEDMRAAIALTDRLKADLRKGSINTSRANESRRDPFAMWRRVREACLFSVGVWHRNKRNTVHEVRGSQHYKFV